MTTDRVLTIDAAVAAVLRAEAAAQQIPWPALAERSEVKESTFFNYMHGRSAPKLATLDRIAQALGMDVLEVIRRARERMGA